MSQLGKEIGIELQKNILLPFDGAEGMNLIGKGDHRISTKDVVFHAVDGNVGVTVPKKSQLDSIVKMGAVSQCFRYVPCVPTVDVCGWVFIGSLHRFAPFL